MTQLWSHSIEKINYEEEGIVKILKVYIKKKKGYTVK